MKRRAASLALLLLVAWLSPALARDLDDDRREPAVSATPEPQADPFPYVAPPPDLYYVTDTYVADVVSSDGPLTTYSTTTVHESTGSYARVLETVGTGVSSAYDGRSFNGRRALADGRLVAGTYYENYVLTSSGFVPVSIVFFQDDAELARLLAATPSPGVNRPTQAPVGTARPGRPTCCQADRPGTTARPGPTAAPTAAPTKPIRPGISLLPAGAPLAGLEVLRGRTVALWARAFVEDHEVPVRSWSVVSGYVGDAPATAGPGGVPLRTSWPRLAPPGAAFQIVLRIEVDTLETGHRTADVAIAVVVRSPALED
jgi:hypothetical protein